MRDAPFTVGFAAETEKLREHALKKLESKKVDMIAANQVGPACGFDRETNTLEVFWPGGSVVIGEDTKLGVPPGPLALIAQPFPTPTRRDRPPGDPAATRIDGFAAAPAITPRLLDPPLRK